jgi:hypothetical protein
MTTTLKGRGGPGRGQGRKTIGDTPTTVRSVRLTQAQWEKYVRLGGTDWLRQRLDKAKEPA